MIKSAQRGLHFFVVHHLVGHRAWVLFFKALVERGKPRITPQIRRESVHDLNILKVFIRDIKCRLTGSLKRIQKVHLKGLQHSKVRLELGSIKSNLFGPCMFYVG